MTEKYLVVGKGRLASHMTHYMTLLGLSFDQWSRSASPDSLLQLQQKISQATHVLVLISDREIESFVREHKGTSTATWMHFSGALDIPKVDGLHPLMTFGPELYDLSKYQQIPFVVTSEKDFSDLLPGFPNRFHKLSPEKKAQYHAFCVMSGNFTTLLWQKMDQGLQSLGLPNYFAHPYLEAITENLVKFPDTALTGPIARKDIVTLKKNLSALNGDPHQKIFRAFLEIYCPEALL